nr:MAG TPA: hypothetical protein [Caudoviricetes sp.]
MSRVHNKRKSYYGSAEYLLFGNRTLDNDIVKH